MCRPLLKGPPERVGAFWAEEAYLTVAKSRLTFVDDHFSYLVERDCKRTSDGVSRSAHTRSGDGGWRPNGKLMLSTGRISSNFIRIFPDRVALSEAFSCSHHYLPVIVGCPCTSAEVYSAIFSHQYGLSIPVDMLSQNQVNSTVTKLRASARLSLCWSGMDTLDFCLCAQGVR